MVSLLFLVLLATYGIVFVTCFWRRRGGTLGLTHAVWAAVVSSATTGIWVTSIAPLFPSYPSAHLDVRNSEPLAAFAAFTLAIALFSVGPNLIGMALINEALQEHRTWQRAFLNGLFAPAGMLYGVGVLVISSLPVMLPTIWSTRPEELLRLFGSNVLYVTAVPSGVVAVGTYVLLERAAAMRSQPLA